MSWQAMDAVDQLAYDLTGPLAYRVLVKLANVADQNGRRAFRSKFEMADELGVSTRSIQRALSELEHLHLIRRGDQRHVSHLRGDRRPTVYDIVMHPTIAGQQPLSDGETDGETRLSTGSDGETDGETTVVVSGELRELTTQVKKEADHRGRSSQCPSGATQHRWMRDGRCSECWKTPIELVSYWGIEVHA